jgi:hypothetical protein
MKTAKRRFLLSFSAMALLLGILTGCNKNDKGDQATDEDTSYASDQSLSEKMFDDAQNISDKASVTTGSGSFKTSACGTVTHSLNSFIIDFGTSNCLCNDGRNRRGKIIVSYTGAYADKGSVHTITFEDYYQNDNKVEGTKTVTNRGNNSAGMPYFDINVTGSVIREDGTVITCQSTRRRTWIAGYDTPINWTDDKYEITGEGVITRPSGSVNVSIPLSTPLIVSLDCRWIEAGTIVYSMSNGLIRSLNYGNTPVCDNKANVVLPNGTSKEITLP